MSNKSFQVIVALFDTWHQHKRNFYIETTLKNNMYCKHSHCSMKQTFMKYVWLKIVKISKCTIKRPHCSIWLKFASIGLLWMSQEATSTIGKCNQWVLEQHPLTFILPRKSNSKLPLFGEHRPFRRWLIALRELHSYTL